MGKGLKFFLLEDTECIADPVVIVLPFRSPSRLYMIYKGLLLVFRVISQTLVLHPRIFTLTVNFTAGGVAVVGLKVIAVGKTEGVGELLQSLGGHCCNKL